MNVPCCYGAKASGLKVDKIKYFQQATGVPAVSHNLIVVQRQNIFFSPPHFADYLTFSEPHVTDKVV